MPPDAGARAPDARPTLAAELRMRVVTTFRRRATLMVRDLSAADDAPAASHARIARIARLDPADIDAYLRLRPRATRAGIEARIARGDVAVAAWVDGRIAHAAWVATGRTHIPYLGCDLVLDAGEMLVHDSFTDPAHRHAGLAHARMMWVFREWARLGFRRCFAVVAEENEVGRRAMASAGYREVGRYVCVRLGPWSRCRQVTEQGATLPRLVAHAAR